jgi:hypothetical protein
VRARGGTGCLACADARRRRLHTGGKEFDSYSHAQPAALIQRSLNNADEHSVPVQARTQLAHVQLARYFKPRDAS